MTRYKDHKHGIVIGWDNWWFFKDWNGDYHDSKCIWWARELIFDNHSTLHCNIETPLRQLIYYTYQMDYEEDFTYPETMSNKDIAGTTIKLPKIHTLTILRPHFVQWLNKYAEGWKCPVGPHRDASIFFAKRKHAMAFTRYVEGLLKGMDFL